MLRIIQNRSATSAKSYYSKASYYGEGQEKAGVWRGRVARMLGLSGQIQQEDFDALCDNKDPRNGQQLTARHNHNRTVGYDFNWHVPKGVSLAFAFGDNRIEGLFQRAVDETMAEIETEAQTRVRIGGKHQNRVTGNLVWGNFVHTTARPNDQGEVDPHLHAHCFVFNITFDKKENRFKAAQFRELKRDASFFEAKMHGRLARLLRDELGYSIVRKGRFWDIAGIPESMIEKFSERTTEIERIAEDEHITNAEEKAEIGSRSRNTKSNKMNFEKLQETWRKRLGSGELSIFDRLKHAEPTIENGPDSIDEAVSLALSHCFERDSVLSERRVQTEILRRATGMIDVLDVDKIAKQAGILAKRVGGRTLATIPEALNDEKAILNFARKTRHSVQPLNANWQPANSWLSKEQIKVIKGLVTSDDRMQLILGGAGTGKTTLMKQAVKAIEDGGHQVFVFAPSAEASRKVLRDEGFENATTVAELLISKELQAKAAGNIIWVDEASLIGTKSLRKLFEFADRNHSRLILSGDWKRQHGSVERGGILSLIEQYAGLKPKHIKTIRRQTVSKYKDAISAMAGGFITDGFDKLYDLGWVHEMPDESRYDVMARDYVETVKNKQSALVVAPTHSEGKIATEAIRKRLKEDNLIDNEDFEFQRLVPRHLTEGEKRDPAYFTKGDILIFHKNAKGFKKGDRVEVGDIAPGHEILKQADRFSVYRPTKIGFAKGDMIRMTAGGQSKDGKYRFNNGRQFQIQRISPSGDIVLDNGRTLDRRFGLWNHGFVTTSHNAQSRSVDQVFVVESSDSSKAANAEQFYVSCSRGKKKVTVYTDSAKDLREMISESANQPTATEIFDPILDFERYRKQLLANRPALPQTKQNVSHELVIEKAVS